jgi:hypothetical protein
MTIRVTKICNNRSANGSSSLPLSVRLRQLLDFSIGDEAGHYKSGDGSRKTHRRHGQRLKHRVVRVDTAHAEEQHTNEYR